MSTSRKNKQGVKRSLDFVSQDESNGEAQQQRIVPSGKKSTNDATPVKKTKKNITDFFGSPAPSSSAARTLPVVTPPDFKKKEEVQYLSEQHTKKKRASSAHHVPTYIHKNVGYVREGEASLDPTTQKVFDLVDHHYIIPEGFENNRKFGPISGMSFEQRVIACYCNNLLDPKEGGQVEICTKCAEMDHKRDDCPTLL
jgi:hypothetical protein